MNGWVGTFTDGWIDGWMDGWMDRSMDGGDDYEFTATKMSAWAWNPFDLIQCRVMI